MAEYRWKRGEGDFAVRVDLETIRGVFQKGVVVEPGCKALLEVDGALVAELGAGEYNEGGIVAKLRNFDLTRFATAIILDVGDVELRFTVPGVMTKDPMQIDVDCSLVIQVDKPEFFLTNVMKGRTSLARMDLQQRLSIEVENALQEAIGKESVENLNTNLELKEKFEAWTGEHLRRTFSRAGFGLIQFRTITYRYRGFDKIRGLREDYYLQLTEAEARLDGRKRLFDAFDRNELQTIFEATRKLERQVLEQRERARLARELNPLLVDEHKSTEQMEAFLLEMEKGKLLRQQELSDYKRTLNEAHEDAESARKFLLKRVDLERELEYERSRLIGRAGLELELWEAESKGKRARLDFELAEDRERRMHDRAQALDDHRHSLELELTTAKNDLEKATLGSRIREIQVQAYKLWKEVKISLKDKEARARIERKLGAMAEKIKLRLLAERERMVIAEDAKDRDQQRKLDMVKALAGASAEAVIAMAGETQARMIADIKRIEALKGFSEEQILAMAADKDSRLADAFAKKFEGLAKEDLELLHNQMLSAERSGKEQQARIMQEMFDKALEMQRDIAVAAANANRPTVVTGAGGYGAAVVSGASVAGGFRCTYCGADIPPHNRFCGACGKAVAGAPPAS